jgi:DNA polymerase (family 10)
MREDRGEIEAAQRGTLPTLVELSDIRGDLHTHTIYSDGKSSLEEMISAAKQRDYEYIAITDHVGSLQIAKALDEPALFRQIAKIRDLDEDPAIRVLAGAEVNIHPNGTLDLSEDALDQLDFVIGSLHSNLRMDRKKITDRILKALTNEYLTILGHPTGRLLNRRPASDIDLIEVFDTAKAQGKFLEINAYPARLDLNDVNCRTANQHGVGLAIGTDAHSATQLKFMELGAAVARRGWLEKNDLLNTLPLKQLLKRLHIQN